MKRTQILCPNCLKGKLLQEDEKNCYCDQCGTDFIKIGENTVKFK